MARYNRNPFDIPPVDPRLVDTNHGGEWMLPATFADVARVEIWAYVGFRPVRRLAAGPAVNSLSRARGFVERNRSTLLNQLGPDETFRIRMVVSPLVPRTPPRMSDVGAPSFRDTPPPVRPARHVGVTVEIDEMDEDVADATAMVHWETID